MHVHSPDTSNSEVNVHLRHVISRAGLGDAVVTGVFDQRSLSEPAADQHLCLTQGLPMLHYGGVQAVPVYKPVNVDITGTWGTNLDFMLTPNGRGMETPHRHETGTLAVDWSVVFSAKEKLDYLN